MYMRANIRQNKHSHWCQPYSRFTLVELLVIISIMTILMAVLMPGLRSAQESGRAVHCQNNLKQLGLAGFIFAENSNGYWPQLFNGSYTYYQNAAFLENYLAKEVQRNPSQPQISLSIYNVPLAQLCPNQTLSPSNMANGLAQLTGYGMSWQGLRDENTSFNPWTTNSIAYRLPKIKRPSQKLIHLDTVSYHIIADCADPLLSSSPRVDYRHTGYSANTLYFDGHVVSNNFVVVWFPTRTAGDCWDTYDRKP